jgi:riboflavin kinase/FMN adenylyltransferase
MSIVDELTKARPERDTVLTIGVFDGVHLGHQHLISQLKEKSKEAGLLSVVVTFSQHPQAMLAPYAELPYLTSLEERVELIQALGVGHIVVLPFTNELAQLTARDFISLLREFLRMRRLVIGPDFALGRGREGNAEVLRSLGQKFDFAVEIVPPLMIGEQVVSSTTIRRGLAEGDVENIATMLGRRFRLSGTVVHGDHRGGPLLGFPTANLAIPGNHVLPADGIYFTLAHLKDAGYRSATSIGVRPTFDPGDRTIETYILDFNGDLYGRQLTIEFVRRLRDELRFETPDALKAQIESDVTIARTLPIE